MAGAGTWVIVASGFHQRGGTDRANAALAQYLVSQGVQVHLVAHDVEPSLADHPSVTVHRVPLPLGVSALTDWALNRQGRRVAAGVAGRDPHARVVVNGGNCLWPDVNWVHYLHHAWTPTTDDRPALTWIKDAVVTTWGRSRERAALGQARWIITNSESTSRLVCSHVPAAADRVRCVYLGAESDWTVPTDDERSAARRRFSLEPDTPAVVFVGGLGFDHRKGFDTLWRAWNALDAEGDWHAQLVVAGDGAALEYWRGVVGRSRAAASVRLLGFTSDVKELLAAADLLVSPTKYEPFGLNVQEALCRGVPAIVSALAGVAERYPESLGGWLLPDPEDAACLAARLRRWTLERAEWRQQAVALGGQLRAYRWHDMAARLVSTVSP